MSSKLQNVIEDWSGGVNTRKPAHELGPGECRMARWADMTFEGGITKAKGVRTFDVLDVFSFTQPVQSLHYARIGSTGHLLAVYTDALYQWIPTKRRVTVILYPPYDAAAEEVTGVCSLSPSTTYTYKIAFGDGFRTGSADETISITTSATPKPIKIRAKASFGAATSSYKLYRKEAGTWKLLNQVSATVSREDLGSGNIATMVTFTDDGTSTTTTQDPPNPSRDFKPQLIGVGRADFQVYGSKVYFAGGICLCEYDLKSGLAQVVKPASYDPTYGPNALLDHNHPIHWCTNLASHQNYNFAMNNNFEPTKAYYSRLGRWDYWPTLSVLDAPDANGGRILDADVIYDVLSFALTTGRYTLHGKTFTPDSVNFDGYWSKISDLGVPSPRCTALVPANGRELIVAPGPDKNIYGLHAEASVETRYNTRPLADHITTKTSSDLDCLDDITDWANAAAIFHNGRYIISFPADKKIWVGYPDRRQDGQFSWFGPWTGLGISCWAVRADGVLLGGSSEHNRIYEFGTGYWLTGHTNSDLTAYTMQVRTRTLMRGLSKTKLKRAYLKGQKPSTGSSTCAVKVNVDGVYSDEVTVSFADAAKEAPLVLTELKGRGRSMYYEIRNATGGEPLTIYGIHELFSLKDPK